MSEILNTLYDEKLGVGEILICNNETKGTFEQLKYFIGKVILTIGGGDDKIYVVEAKDKVSSEVKSIQLREYQDLMKTDTKFNQNYDSTNKKISEFPPQDKQNDGNDPANNPIPTTNQQNDLGDDESQSQIIQICKGKYHLVKLTNDGKVRCSGASYFGVSGLGGSESSATTKILPNLAKLKIVQIAAGVYHSLALSENGDLYVWGIGFEGQLGLTQQFKVASSPRYLKAFYRKPIKFIACGHNYSLAITKNGDLYGWGENKLGQLGLGHRQIIEKPTLIPILDQSGGQEGCSSSESLVNEKLERQYTNKPLKVKYAAAGYSHTVVLTEEGIPVTFGLNIYGQLGLGNNITSFEPKLIEKDELGDYLEEIVKASCCITGTFLISKSGKMYSCGSGDIGHGHILGMVKLPKIIGGQRLYSHVFCNINSTIAFSPLRILSISPSCGPATGNTILSIIGTAFKDEPKLSVRFIFGGVSRDIRGSFDKLSRTIFVNTPNFLDFSPNMELPCNCVIQVTFDGHYYTEYHDKFLIYPNNLKITQIEPTNGPIAGGDKLQALINLDQIGQKYLFSLTVGFQAKQITSEVKSKKKQIKNKNKKNESLLEEKINISNNKSIQDSNNMYNPTNNSENKKPEELVINPMDIENFENQLDKANWYCCFSTYQNGVMTCTIPKIENFDQGQVEYNVDVAINGQQFSGHPMLYRFYDIKVDKIEPNISLVEGGLRIKIFGTGFFDSECKKAKIVSSLGERNVDIEWNKPDKTLFLDLCPLNWIVSDQSIINTLKPEDLYNKYAFKILLTMNGTHWIEANSFKYCDPKVDRINYITFKETDNKEERINQLSVPQELTEEEKIVLGMLEPYADKKKLAEFEKKVKDDEDALASFKRPYNGLALYGPFFPNIPNLFVRFCSQNGDTDVTAYYHNSKKIACLIPEMPKLPPGQYELNIMISYNNQQWVDTGLKINFISPEEGASFEDIVKGEEADKKKKPGKK